MMANSQGRDIVLAVIAGIFFGVFAVIGYLIAGDTLEAKARKQIEMQRIMERMRH
jgi:hypothetical protein